MKSTLAERTNDKIWENENKTCPVFYLPMGYSVLLAGKVSVNAKIYYYFRNHYIWRWAKYE